MLNKQQEELESRYSANSKLELLVSLITAAEPDPYMRRKGLA